jgi:hypothetical protein
MQLFQALELIEKRNTMKHKFMLFAALLLASVVVLQAADRPETGSPVKAGAGFEAVADAALQAMARRAVELDVKGVAVVAYAEGEAVKGWSSKMAVVGVMTNPPSEKSKGANLLGIAYAKAAEMAETLKNSGQADRKPLTGEFGWQGGVIKKIKTGYLIAAFSGGPSEADVKISQAGLDTLAGNF